MKKRDYILKRQDENLNQFFKKAKITILGCGGLGSNIAFMLARSGVGTLNLFDYDVVEYSNLNRQNYNIDDIGKKKVFALEKNLKKAIPYVNINSYDRLLNKENIKDYMNLSNIFIEAFDKKEEKAFLFDFFLENKNKKLIMASGLSGLGDLADIKVKRIRNVTMIGDFKSETNNGLYMPYLMTIASLEALEALKIIKEMKNGR